MSAEEVELRESGAGEPLERVKRRYQRYLTTHGYSDTQQRREILEEIYRKRRHFDVEELVREMRKRGSRVSRATVYRTISHFEKSGLVRRLSFDEDHAHYEITLGAAHHEHLICESCGRVVEITDSALEKCLRRILRAEGFSDEAAHTVEIMAVCRECLEAESDEASAEDEAAERRKG
jgi:Fur family ferric uptake transcriptional regulator